MQAVRPSCFRLPRVHQVLHRVSARSRNLRCMSLEREDGSRARDAMPMETKGDGGNGRVTKKRELGSVNVKDVLTPLATSVKDNVASAADVYNELCSAKEEKSEVYTGEGESRKKTGQWSVAPPDKLYKHYTLTNKLTGPWSISLPPQTVFVGHKIPDTDAVCSAIAAAELFRGVPARAGELNSETEFVLKNFGVTQPLLYSEVKETHHVEDICLVDHNQVSQIADDVALDKICGIIDHHAFQNGTLTTRVPIYADVRPWGSASSIVAHAYIQHRHPLSKTSASLLLAGIISDTLSLCSPTTTDYDRMMVAFLAYAAEIRDVDTLAKEMFQAKSKDLEKVNTYSLVRGDMKKFDMRHETADTSLRIAIGVVECTDPLAVTKRSSEIIEELEALKLEEDVDMAYVIVVDVLKLVSEVISPADDEFDLASQAFEGGVVTDGRTIKLQRGRVSRKLDFMPSLAKILETGWEKKAPAEDEGKRMSKKQKLGHVRMFADPVSGNFLGRSTSHLDLSGMGDAGREIAENPLTNGA